jgi:hypothetical protein
MMRSRNNNMKTCRQIVLLLAVAACMLGWGHGFSAQPKPEEGRDGHRHHLRRPLGRGGEARPSPHPGGHPGSWPVLDRVRRSVGSEVGVGG